MLHNFYTLKGGNGSATAFNSVNKTNYKTAVRNVPYWAKTLVLTDDEGQRATSPTTLEYVNSDPGRGGKLRAMYRGSVMSVAGRKYVKVSLCYDDAGTKAVSSATVDFDGDGDLIEITAVLYLETEDGDNVCFCSGDNPLVRKLLGCGESGQMKIGWGDCLYPSRSCRRTADKMIGFGAASVVHVEEGIDIASQTVSPGSEAVVFDGETPVLRALRTPSYSIRTTSVTVDGHNAALYSQNIPENLSSVRLGSTSMLKLDTCRVYDGFYPVRENDGWYVGESGYLVSDPSGKYMAVVTEAYIDVYEVDSLDLKPVGRLQNYPDYTIYILRNGELAISSPKCMEVFTPLGDGTFDRHAYSVSNNKGLAVVLEGEYYHVITLEAAYFYIYKLSPTVREYSRVTSNANYMFASRCGDYLAYGDAKQFKVSSLDVDYTSEFTATALQQLGVTRKCVGFGEYCVLFTVNKTEYYVYDFVHDVITPLNGVGHIDNNLVYDSENVYVYDHYNGLRRLPGNYDLSGVTGITLAGDGLFMVRNGRFEVYYCDKNALALRVPRGHEGEKLFANVRERKYPSSGSPVKFTVYYDE